MRVADEMVSENLPTIDPAATALEVIKAISGGSLGPAVVHHSQRTTMLSASSRSSSEAKAR